MTTFTTNNKLGGTQQAMTTSFKTLVNVYATSGSLRRTYLQEFSVAPSEAPNATDCTVEFDVSVMTAEGTATTLTPNHNTGLETGTQVACFATSKGNHTAEPTITSNSSRFAHAMNQRGAFRWAAIDQDDVLIGPAVAANGWVLRLLSSNYTGKAIGQLKFRE